MSLLEQINSPQDLKRLTLEDLPTVAEEVRRLIKEVVAKNGGHLASSLGTVEMLIALNYVFDFSRDRLLLDVGHQCYAHKILTGRKDTFTTLRQKGGISGFPSPAESVCDPLYVGHASSSVSTALGFSAGFEAQQLSRHSVALIGDGSMTGGMAYEALNHAGHLKTKLLIVLNDNNMAIAENIGGLADYLSRIRAGTFYNKLKKDVHDTLSKLPRVGEFLEKTLGKVKESLKSGLLPGHLFEALGIRYLGPFDGHSIPALVETFEHARLLEGPTLVHVITEKGRGYAPAAKKPCDFHYAGPETMADINGEAECEVNGNGNGNGNKLPGYGQVAGNTLCDLAQQDDRLVAISAAMLGGTGLTEFARCYPKRCFDVGIAEEHAVAFAAGLAASGMKPVVAIYSVFLQRAYDQIFEELCLQKDLGVVVLLDRAGLVGADGCTHHGAFDIAYLRHLPNTVIMAPRDAAEMEEMLKLALTLKRPVFIRYPKGPAPVLDAALPRAPLALGKSEILRSGGDVAIFALGAMIPEALSAAEILAQEKISCAVHNARWVTPLDSTAIEESVGRSKLLVTIEDGTLTGGFGSAVLEHLNASGIDTPLLRLGLPHRFIEHGARKELLVELGLDADGIANAVRQRLNKGISR